MAHDELSRVFQALADPTRRDVVGRLAAGDATVGELASPYGMTVQGVSKHLKVLEDAGLVSRTGDTHRRPCHLEADVLDLMTGWIDRYRREAEARFARLDDVLADLDARHRSDAKAGRPPRTRKPATKNPNDRRKHHDENPK